jgi:signal transduction histidine kinase/ActR/RegA family two-component response regulator
MEDHHHQQQREIRLQSAKIQVAVSFPHLKWMTFDGPSQDSFSSVFDSEYKLKQWVWEVYREQLFQHMKVCAVNVNNNNNNNNNNRNNSPPSHLFSMSETAASAADHTSVSNESVISSVGGVAPTTNIEEEDDDEYFKNVSETNSCVPTMTTKSTNTAAAATLVATKRSFSESGGGPSSSSSGGEDANSHAGGGEVEPVVSSKHSKLIIGLLESEIHDHAHKLQLANEALAKANRKILEESQRQLEHFACMSHEIRTPLNGILGLSSLILREAEDDEIILSPKVAEHVRLIHHSGELLLNVVNDVLDYAKYESEQHRFEIGRWSLQDTLESIVRPISNRALHERQVIIRCFYDTSVPEYIHTDPRRLQQILYNLLGNAVKFSKQGGLVEFHLKVCPRSYNMNYCSPLCVQGCSRTPTVSIRDAIEQAEDEQQAIHTGSSVDPITTTATTTTVEGTMEEEDDDEANEFIPKEVDLLSLMEDDTQIQQQEQQSQSNEVLRFVVKDYGKGIKECDFDRIFQPFQQANDDDHDRHYEGTGLGLPITAKLVKGLGGTIYVDSVEGEWAAFTVEFPFIDEAPANMKTVEQSMAHATVFFVFDDCFPGTVAHFEHCCRLYHVQVRSFQDFDTLVAYTSFPENLDPNRTYLCVCYDVQFDRGLYQKFASRCNAMLMTFGPQHLVKDGVAHIPCPNSVVPCALMDLMCKCVQSNAGKTNSSSSNRNMKLSRETKSSEIPVQSMFTNVKVLVAEDNIINQKILRLMLKKLGLGHVDVVNNGKEAVDMEASQNYDVVLLDMQMPVMDGLTACHLIKARYPDVGSGPKIAFVTAQVTEAFRVETVKAGASGFLSKPFTLERIDQCIKELLFLVKLTSI